MGEAANVAGALALQGTGGGDHGLGPRQPADPPAGHGPALGKAVHGENSSGQVGGHGRKAVVGEPWGQQKFVDLITHHRHLGMATQHRGDRLEILQGEHHAGGVGGAVEHQQLAGRGDRRLHLVGIEPEPVGRGTGDQAHAGAGQLGHFWIAEPVGRRQQQFIAGPQEHLEEVVEGLLAAVGDEHLVGGGGNLIFSAEFCGNRLA